MSFNVNVYNFNFNGVQSDLFEGINQSSFSGVNDILSDIFNDYAQLLESVGNLLSGDQPIAPGGCCLPPTPSDSCHPQGSLKTDGNVVTTPGGYKIEATSQFEWKITGPDGKTTRVWGDPHVAEGDGGKWDFKRNSTFVLGDGTRINVTTAPWQDGKMTVTSGLEIISGNDRVQISDIDKGKGKIGEVTADGYAHANSFAGNDVFVMGRETDDWSFQGKEVIGSENGGESFKLGNELPAGSTNRPSPWENAFGSWLNNFFNDMMGGWNNSWKPNRFGSNPYYNGLNNGNSNNLWAGNDNNGGINYDRSRHQNQMRQAFRLFGELFNVLARLDRLSNQMSSFRTRALYA